VYFGTASGLVAKADAGGQDLGEPYVSFYVPKFQEFNSADDKFALHARVTYRAVTLTPVRMVCYQNYAVGDTPGVSPDLTEGGSRWGGGAKWGDGTKWGATTLRLAVSEWQAVSGAGFSLAPGLVVTSNRTTQPEFEISSIQLRYEKGRAI
jgi:hypothetical protein